MIGTNRRIQKKENRQSSATDKKALEKAITEPLEEEKSIGKKLFEDEGGTFMSFISNNDIDKLFHGIEINGDDQKKLKENFSYAIDNLLSAYTAERINNKLKIIFEYEKHYLDLMKEYKEEIKFANTLQEDLRRERAQFFSQNLKEVAESLKESQVEDAVASRWIQELVKSYTDSLDICQGLADIQVIDTIGKLRQESSKEMKSIKLTDEQ